MGNYTTYLTAKSSFLTGAASAFNLAGNFYPYITSETPEEADARAMRADLLAVGEDFHSAFGEFKKEKPSQMTFQFNS
jgi:hypothetical protein